MPPDEKKSWPMKWVVLSIVLFIAGYTIVMFLYRKPGPAYRPYQDATNRATVSRLLAAGFQRGSLAAERPADPSTSKILEGRSPAAISAAPGGLDPDLEFALAEKPMLAEAIRQVTAAGASYYSAPYRVLFTASLKDHKRVISGGQFFKKEDQLFLLPEFEPIRGELLARTKETTAVLTIPAGTLKPGVYQTTLVAEKGSRCWRLTVK